MYHYTVDCGNSSSTLQHAIHIIKYVCIRICTVKYISILYTDFVALATGNLNGKARKVHINIPTLYCKMFTYTMTARPGKELTN